MTPPPIFSDNNKLIVNLLSDHVMVLCCLLQVMYDKYSGRSRRFAFVTMSSVEDANAAIEKLNNTVNHSNPVEPFFSNLKSWFIGYSSPYSYIEAIVP